MKNFAIAGAISLALILPAQAQTKVPPMVRDVVTQWTAKTISDDNYAKSMNSLMQDYQRVTAENENLKAELEKLKPPAPAPAPTPAAPAPAQGH